jgi:hypothetical protein
MGSAPCRERCGPDGDPRALAAHEFGAQPKGFKAARAAGPKGGAARAETSSGRSAGLGAGGNGLLTRPVGPHLGVDSSST